MKLKVTSSYGLHGSTWALQYTFCTYVRAAPECHGHGAEHCSRHEELHEEELGRAYEDGRDRPEHGRCEGDLPADAPQPEAIEQRKDEQHRRDASPSRDWQGILSSHLLQPATVTACSRRHPREDKNVLNVSSALLQVSALAPLEVFASRAVVEARGQSAREVSLCCS